MDIYALIFALGICALSLPIMAIALGIGILSMIFKWDKAAKVTGNIFAYGIGGMFVLTLFCFAIDFVINMILELT